MKSDRVVARWALDAALDLLLTAALRFYNKQNNAVVRKSWDPLDPEVLTVSCAAPAFNDPHIRLVPQRRV